MTRESRSAAGARSGRPGGPQDRHAQAIRDRDDSGQGRFGAGAPIGTGPPAERASGERRQCGSAGCGGRGRSETGTGRSTPNRVETTADAERAVPGGCRGRRRAPAVRGLVASPGAAMRPPGRERTAMPRGSPVSGPSGGARRPVRGTPCSPPSCRPSPSGCGVWPSSAPRRRYPHFTVPSALSTSVATRRTDLSAARVSRTFSSSSCSSPGPAASEEGAAGPIPATGPRPARPPPPAAGPGRAWP